MTFKKCLADDLNVFFNPEEFGEEHDLNGTKCLAVIEGLTTTGQITRSTVNFAAVHGKTVIVHTKTAEVPEVPEKGTIFTLDGDIYQIADSADDCGLLTIMLEADAM